MIFYEVSVKLPTSQAQKFESYMRDRHIPEIWATQCFVQIHFAQIEENHFRTCYQAQSLADYERYLAQFATAMRTDFMQHFPQDCQVERQVWRGVQTWKAT